jgi:hypothetical protein
MIKSIKEYLHRLKNQLANSDRAIIQDALSDAEEHLRDAYNNALVVYPNMPEEEALAQVIEKYGTPGEVAAAYHDIEVRTPPALARKKIRSENRSTLARFFGVYTDPSAWGALLYMIISLGTGIAYFVWAVTGLSVSAGLMVLIIGIFIFGLFLLSVRVIALIEGRIVEGLLGVRMPTRPLFSDKTLGWWDRFKSLFTDGYTWSAMIYMVIHLPIGVFYFTLVISLIATSLWAILLPLFQVGLNWDRITSITIGGTSYQFPDWFTFVITIAGFLLLTTTMHLARTLGRKQGALAKSMLVRKDTY